LEYGISFLEVQASKILIYNLLLFFEGYNSLYG